MKNPSVVVKKVEGKEFSCDLVIEDRPIPEIDDGTKEYVIYDFNFF